MYYLSGAFLWGNGGEQSAASRQQFFDVECKRVQQPKAGSKRKAASM